MRRALFLFAAFAVPVLAAPAQDADPVRKKLDAARTRIPDAIQWE